jgi:hypothetical protein
LLVAGFLAAQMANANVCDAAAYRAAQETGVPAEVLLTITRLETGRSQTNGDPWPWTVNHAGDGTWFPSEDDARSYVFSKVKRGASNIDIGCFQINYHWHADGFRSLDDMFNPDLNALYAANFLDRLHTEFGDWIEAAGAYHSRTPEFAGKYKAKFREFKARVDQLEPMRVQSSQPSVKLVTQSAGSLFVANVGGVTPFIDLGRSN